MLEIKVSRSPKINVDDDVKIDNETRRIQIFDKNDTGRDLILIYMYQLPNFREHGVKVGMTKCKEGEEIWKSIKNRIERQDHELALPDEQYKKYGLKREVCFWGICIDAKNESFKDYAVHKNINFEKAGIVRKDQEWFANVPIDDLIQIFADARKPRKRVIFEPRKEQRECIEKIKEYFNENKKGRFLLNCKMRFGKSYTTYKYAEEVGINKILILTFVPAVEESWHDDLFHIKKEYKYYTDDHLKNGTFVDTPNVPYVLFLSLQNYLGKSKDNQVKDRIKKLQGIKWDLVILDEYHFGAWNSRTQGKIKKLVKGEEVEDLSSEYQNALLKAGDVIDEFKIATEKVICLSGTPFKALAKGEFNDTSSYTYSYFDEQRNKYPKSEENNFDVVREEYKHFPDMKILGYNMANLFANLTSSIFSEDKILGKTYFSLNKFFETKKDRNQAEECEFIYEQEIKEWLDIISGVKPQIGYLSPYADPNISDKIKHSLWLMPTVNSCKAMAKLLHEDNHFSKYKIINLSKEGVGAGKDALRYLSHMMKESQNTNKGSIAITVNKLTIGVTVKEWSNVFVLKDLASPEQYFQAIFRVQTPFKEKDEILKKDAFVFDFNIDRASALLLRYATESENVGEMTKLEIAKLIVKYIPIFINGNMSKRISEDIFFQLAEYGDSSGVPLSKRITNVSNVTKIDNEDTIANMVNDPETSEVLKKVFAHAKFPSTRIRTVPIKPLNGFDKTEAKKGRDLGRCLGEEDSDQYKDYDDKETQEKFEKKIEEHINEHMPHEYNKDQKTWFKNGFIKGYEEGVNAPIKKLYCGRKDGEVFVNKVKKKFGSDIKYNQTTSREINNYMNEYLKDENNIPEEYRGMLYKRWYVDSFKRTVRGLLTDNDGIKHVEDVENILHHILARLFEFLYISIYRETKFEEIFKNANPNRFIEAVGITKKDFEMLNKYNIFQEKILNNFISDFFANESLGREINPNDTNLKRYRNSFNWFGFGEK